MRDIYRNTVLIVLLTILPAYSHVFSNKPLVLTQKGETKYKIILSENCREPEKNAALELQYYLTKISGVKFEISPIEEQNGCNIYVGTSAAARKLLPDIDFSKLKPDEIIIKTVGSSCILTGEGARGSLYAVYTFLEDILGVRWWTATECFVPENTCLIIDPPDIQYAPALEFREVYYHGIASSKQGSAESIFAVRSKINGNYENISPKYGGHYNYAGPNSPCSGTFDKLIPAKTYLKKHPEWFSLVDNKRIGGLHIGQLCLTNEEMKAELIKNAESWLEQYSDAEWIAVSMNDNSNYCQCAKCQEVAAAEGAQSGVLVRFLNSVADALKQKKSDIKIVSSAYRCYRCPPKKSRLKENVIIRIAPIETNYLYPICSSENSVIQEDFKGWRQIADKIFVWDYIANYRNYLAPYPNWSVFAPNIRYFIGNGAIGVYEEGVCRSSLGDFIQLRVWLISHLLWKPQADENALMKEFMTGYYGAAAPFLIDYLNCYRNAAVQARINLACEGTQPFIPSLDVLEKCWNLFEKAEVAVAGNPILKQRVLRERGSLSVLFLQNPNLLRWLNSNSDRKTTLPDGQTILTLLGNLNETYRPKRFADENSFADYKYRCEQKLKMPIKPSEFPALRVEQWLDFQESYLTLWNEGKTSHIVSDENASNKKAARLVGNADGWDINCELPTHIELGNPWHCYAVMRCDALADDGAAAQIGIVDKRAGRNTPERIPFSKVLSIRELKGDRYKLVDLGIHTLSREMLFWVAPANRPLSQLGAVYVDRFFLVKEK